MRVLELWRYPVKSMAGEQLTETVLGPLGIPGDRERVVVDRTGRVLTSRTEPKLLRMRATRDARGRVRVDGLDAESPEVASQLRAAAGPSARLVSVSGPERFDIMPLLVATDGAIDALGVDHRRLRPNLVIGGVPGLAEREWEGRFLAVGDAVVGLADLRGRCIMTTWDPETGAQDLGILRRIQERFDGTFALNAWVARGGWVAVGAPVRLLDSFREALPPPLGRYAR
jgi:MOSC domain-containing protein